MQGWRCPTCGSDNLSISVISIAKLVQTLDRDDQEDCNEWSIGDVNQHWIWDRTAPITCDTCGYQNHSTHFEHDSGPPGTIPTIAPTRIQ